MLATVVQDVGGAVKAFTPRASASNRVTRASRGSRGDRADSVPEHGVIPDDGAGRGTGGVGLVGGSDGSDSSALINHAGVSSKSSGDTLNILDTDRPRKKCLPCCVLS